MLERVDLGLDMGIIHPTVLDEAGLELPVVALASSDTNDFVYGFTPAGLGGFVAYDRELGFQGSWPLPPGLEVAGTPIIAADDDGETLWLASTGSPRLHRFMLGPDTGAPIWMETTQLPGVASLTSFRVTSSGRILVVTDGQVREFTYVAGVGWIATDETGFAGITGVRSLDVATNRSNARDYGDPEDWPNWPQVRPEVDHVPCPADLDWDGAVGYADLLLVLANWGPCDLLCPGDANEDDTTGYQDVIAVLSAWGDCP
jgi:hypothetical protein